MLTLGLAFLAGVLVGFGGLLFVMLCVAKWESKQVQWYLQRQPPPGRP